MSSAVKTAEEKVTEYFKKLDFLEKQHLEKMYEDLNIHAEISYVKWKLCAARNVIKYSTDVKFSCVVKNSVTMTGNR